MSVPDDLATLKEKPFADAWMKFEELFAQGNRAFLIGAGCSKCAGLPLTAELTKEVLNSDKLDTTTKAALAAIRDLFDAADANIEDYLSELIDLLAITERRGSRGAKEKSISLAGVSYTDVPLRAAADQIKRGIAAITGKPAPIDTHQRFVRAVHRQQRPGKLPSSGTVDYLVLNYDTLLEDALALESVPLADGLEGGETGWWSPETFDRSGLGARVFKLHGSIDWCEFPGNPLPRRVGRRLRLPVASGCPILIWPASTKYRETQLDPFAALAARARRVLRPKERSQCVLVVCGYRFRDAHVNHEIESALRESAGNLTVVVFTEENGPSGQLAEWYKDTSIREQILVFANRGVFHGTHSVTSTKDLLWWKFENLTRLLGGER